MLGKASREAIEKHIDKALSNGTSFMSDGTSILSDAKTIMRDGVSAYVPN